LVVYWKDIPSFLHFIMKTHFGLEYSPLGIFVVISLILAVVIFGASYILSSLQANAEKISTYECGFDPYEDARNAFDVRFYLVAILFIVFDLEAVFLFPWGGSLAHLGTTGVWVMVDFLIELTLGFVYAWRVGALEWE
jgi:NADH-quinone oxidoreductase subunit A